MPASVAAARGAIHHGHRDRWRVPIVALLVGVNILCTGYTLLRRSLIGLLDAALPADDVAKAEADMTATGPRTAWASGHYGPGNRGGSGSCT